MGDLKRVPPYDAQLQAIEEMRREERAREQERNERLDLSRELAQWREDVARRLKRPVVHPHP